jgi:hypothetical protein
MSTEKVTQAGQVSKKHEPREATGQITFEGDNPGATKAPNNSLFFEGLGNLDEFHVDIEASQAEESGDYCVVLSDILSGANGDTFQKGEVQRLSRLIADFATEENRSVVKAKVLRLVTLGAIRHADRYEIEQGYAIVNSQTESAIAQDERAKRIALERENEQLRKENNILSGRAGQDPAATTGPGGDDPFLGG